MDAVIDICSKALAKLKKAKSEDDCSNALMAIFKASLKYSQLAKFLDCVYDVVDGVEARHQIASKMLSPDWETYSNTEIIYYLPKIHDKAYYVYDYHKNKYYGFDELEKVCGCIDMLVQYFKNSKDISKHA